MNYIKMLCSVAVTVTALMVGSASTVSATVLTGAGGATLGVGTTIESTSENATWQLVFFHRACKHTYLHGAVTDAGGAGKTAKGTIDTLTYSNCDNGNFTTLQKGSFEIHGIESGNPVVTSTGMSITASYMGFHCIFSTTNTTLGTLTGSAATKATAVLDVSATIPRTGGTSGAFCGSTVGWTGSFKITSPDVLNVD